jgi:DNA repair exonuclease SbcCD ATPase subunit
MELGLRLLYAQTANRQPMDDKLIIQRLKKLKAQIADIDRRMTSIDELLDNDPSDETVKNCIQEVAKILDEREPILNEARQWLMILNKKASDIVGDAEALPN